MRRKIGLKALELGANAVIGYKQLFDLEGESGIVVRVSENSKYTLFLISIFIYLCFSLSLQLNWAWYNQELSSLLQYTNFM